MPKPLGETGKDLPLESKIPEHIGSRTGRVCFCTRWGRARPCQQEGIRKDLSQDFGFGWVTSGGCLRKQGFLRIECCQKSGTIQ